MQAAEERGRKVLSHEVDELLAKHRLELFRCLELEVLPVLPSMPAHNVQVNPLPSQTPPTLARVSQADGEVKVHAQTLSVLPIGSPLTGSRVEFQLSGLGQDKQLNSKERNRKRRQKASNNSMFMSQRQRSELLAEATALEKLTRGKCYEWFSGILILLNCVFTGWQTEMMAQRALANTAMSVAIETATPSGVVVGQAFFTVLFSIELSLRWLADGFFEFFRTKDLWWNLLDLLCVFIGVVDFAAELLMLTVGMAAFAPLNTLTVIRVLRVVRIIRVVRVIRIMRFFRELRMMVFSIMNCLKSVLWIILILFILFYMFGIIFVSGVMGYLDTLELRQLPRYEALQQHFGCLGNAVLSLYMAMSGGNDWGVYYANLASMHGEWHFPLLFILYITFAIFAVVNIVTGVFVDTALQSGRTDRDVVVQEEIENKKEYLESVKALFEAIDANSHGVISRETLEQSFENETIMAFFTALKISVPDAATLFDLLDFDASGELDIDEFLLGCYQLQGDATGVDAKITQAEVRYVKQVVLGLKDSFQELLEDWNHLKNETLE
ncbi:unnamed protein product [Cladocopium goreaui]|uniref:Gastricsin n=1 Tax=Cladocopium goreaui TaxID=2562237 RepID=A0A9P1BYU7_9DINO|nr:unnamed protein product [Cladocopium goreaui]